MQYDDSILVKFAGDLERQAKALVALCALLGCLIGWGLGELAPRINLVERVGLILVAILVGVVIGRARALNLRIQAHLILCQVEIEHNTRKG